MQYKKAPAYYQDFNTIHVNTLPSTGGAGTTPFAAAGLILMVLALTYSLRFKAFSLKKK